MRVNQVAGKVFPVRRESPSVSNRLARSGMLWMTVGPPVSQRRGAGASSTRAGRPGGAVIVAAPSSKPSRPRSDGSETGAASFTSLAAQALPDQPPVA